MKKLFAVLALSILGICATQAQDKPSFGFKGGLNFTSFDSSNDIDNSTGWHAGIVLHVPFPGKLGLQAEALYSDESGDNIDLSYINVPVLLSYKLVPGLRLHLGPQFKIKANVDTDLEGASDEIEDDFKSLNFDAAVGAEYKFPVIGIFVQARYNIGLSDIGDDFIDSKLNTFQLSAGYRF